MKLANNPLCVLIIVLGITLYSTEEILSPRAESGHGKFDADPMDWERSTPQGSKAVPNWVDEVQPTAHFRRVGKLSQSMGNAHLLFRVNLAPFIEEMKEVCEEITKMKDLSWSVSKKTGAMDDLFKSQSNNSENVKSKIDLFRRAHSFFDEWTVQASHCEFIRRDYSEVTKMWASNARTLHQDTERIRREIQDDLSLMTFWDWFTILFSTPAAAVSYRSNRRKQAERGRQEWNDRHTTTTTTPTPTTHRTSLDYEELMGQSTGAGAPREKRQVLILAALVMSFASLLYSASDLFHFSTTRDDTNIVHHIHEGETQIATNERSIRILNDTLSEVIDQYENLAEEVHMQRSFLRAQNHFMYLKSKWDGILSGLELLAMHRLSPRLVGVELVRTSMAILSRKTQMFGYSLDISELDDLFKFPVSYLAFSNFTIQLFMHIPIKKLGVPIEIYHFLPSPIILENDVFAFPVLEKEYLILDAGATHYRSLTPLQYSQCTTTGSTFSCPDDGLYYSVNDADCLLSLFLGKWEHIKTVCVWVFNDEKNHYAQIGGNDYLVYFPSRQKIELICKQDRWHQEFAGVKRIAVPPGCMAKTPLVTIFGRVDIRIEEATVYKREFKV